MKVAWGFLILAVPLATAGQSVAGTLSLLCMLSVVLRGGGISRCCAAVQQDPVLVAHAWMCWAAFLAMTLWLVVSGLARGMGWALCLDAFRSNLFWSLIPAFLLWEASLGGDRPEFGSPSLVLSELKGWILGVLTVWGIAVGWECLTGFHWVGSERWVLDPARLGSWTRATGFVSHPLTLAYVALIAWPFAMLGFVENPRYRGAWWALAMFAVILLGSGSRTVQGLVLLHGLWCLASLGDPILRRRLLCGACLGLGALVLVPNPIRAKFERTFLGTEDRRAAQYADDRLLFWDAHWRLVKERPWTGHGPEVQAEDRERIYGELGLADFPKKYNAHNAHLQVLADGGLIGLGVWVMAWLATLLFVRRYLMGSPWRRPIQHSIILSLLAMVTQNSFQDSEVRFVLSLVLGLALAEGVARMKLVPRAESSVG